MELNICNRIFQSEEINSISIREKEVFIDHKDDFFRLRYKTEAEIRDAMLYIKIQKLTYQDIFEAIQILIVTCEYFINSKTQCCNCPLHKTEGCILNTIPINWR